MKKLGSFSLPCRLTAGDGYDVFVDGGDMRVSSLLIITAAIVVAVFLPAPVRGQGQEQENAASKEGPMLLERMCLSCHSRGAAAPIARSRR